MRFAKLTNNEDGKPIYVNLENVAYISRDLKGSFTTIKFMAIGSLGIMSACVKETPEEILIKTVYIGG